jgi:hypothetical protein
MLVIRSAGMRKGRTSLSDGEPNTFQGAGHREAAMPDSNTESAEAREAINATLRDILPNPWGRSFWDNLPKTLYEEFQIKTDLLGLVSNAPCLTEMFQVGALDRAGVIKKDTLKLFTEIIHQLVRIAFHAEGGDEKASNQLKVMHKLAYPRVYDLPATVIEGLAKSYVTSPHLARAWAIRWLMNDLCFVVTPVREDMSLLDGAVKLQDDFVFNDGSHLKDTQRYKEAAEHIKRNSTLQSLATSIYLARLKAEGIEIEPEQIKRDFRILREWEEINLTEKERAGWSLFDKSCTHPPAYLPVIPMYSEDWKDRYKQRGAKS